MSAITERVHKAIVAYIREATSETDSKIISKISSWSDEELMRQMFLNLRGNQNGSRGLRLTNFGLTIMKTFFKGYEQKMPDGMTLMPLHLLYLDQHASMPYHCSDEGFCIFDHDLGIKMKLADGHIEILMEIENVQAMMEST
jgi:hypothetical protein